MVHVQLYNYVLYGPKQILLKLEHGGDTDS